MIPTKLISSISVSYFMHMSIGMNIKQMLLLSQAAIGPVSLASME